MVRANAQAAPRRRQGVKAGLDLAKILSAAASIPAGELTMQAVADRLGVDRKAVNHYVSDRETLVRLVTIEAVGRSLAAVTFPAGCDWRVASRIFGRGISSAVTALGSLAGQVQVGASTDKLLMAATETLLAKFIEGGFDLETGVRAISMLTDFCEAHGRRATGDTGEREEWLEAVLREHPEERPRYVLEALNSKITTYNTRQLDLSIEIFIDGLEKLASA